MNTNFLTWASQLRSSNPGVAYCEQKILVNKLFAQFFFNENRYYYNRFVIKIMLLQS